MFKPKIFKILTINLQQLDPVELIDLILNHENEEIKDVNIISNEFKQIKSIVETSKFLNDDDQVIKYLSERVMKIVDINSDFKNELKKVELEINKYEIKNFPNETINETPEYINVI